MLESRLGAFAPAPEDVHLRAELDAQVDGVQGLLQGIGAHLRVIAGEGAILEDRVAEQVGGRHGHDQPGIRQRLAEVLFDRFGFGGRGVDGDQVVVVEVDAIGADFAEQVDQLGGGFVGAGGGAKGVGAAIADRPQAKGEFVLGLGGIVSHLGSFLSGVSGEFNGGFQERTLIRAGADQHLVGAGLQAPALGLRIVIAQLGERDGDGHRRRCTGGEGDFLETFEQLLLPFHLSSLPCRYRPGRFPRRRVEPVLATSTVTWRL